MFIAKTAARSGTKSIQIRVPFAVVLRVAVVVLHFTAWKDNVAGYTGY